MPFKDPAKRAEYQRNRRRLERVLVLGDPPPGDNPTTPPPADPVRIRDAAEVLAVLERAVNGVLADPVAGPQVKGRNIGYLASVALKAIEVSSLAKELAELKAMIQGQKP